MRTKNLCVLFWKSHHDRSSFLNLMHSCVKGFKSLFYSLRIVCPPWIYSRVIYPSIHIHSLCFWCILLSHLSHGNDKGESGNVIWQSPSAQCCCGNRIWSEGWFQSLRSTIANVCIPSAERRSWSKMGTLHGVLRVLLFQIKRKEQLFWTVRVLSCCASVHSAAITCIGYPSISATIMPKYFTNLCEYLNGICKGRIPLLSRAWAKHTSLEYNMAMWGLLKRIFCWSPPLPNTLRITISSATVFPVGFYVGGHLSSKGHL